MSPDTSGSKALAGMGLASGDGKSSWDNKSIAGKVTGTSGKLSKGDFESPAIRGRHQPRAPNVVTITLPKPTFRVNDAGQPFTVFRIENSDPTLTRTKSTGCSNSRVVGSRSEGSSPEDAERRVSI